MVIRLCHENPGVATKLCCSVTELEHRERHLMSIVICLFGSAGKDHIGKVQVELLRLRRYRRETRPRERSNRTCLLCEGYAPSLPRTTQLRLIDLQLA